MLAGVAEGLDFCHARGIVHRDLKPANVLVDAESGRGLLTDFGIAHATDFSTITGPGNLLGTPAYMAPETVMGGRATAASDLWALGAMAYRVATETLPRGMGQPPDTEPVPPSRRNDRLGPDVDRVILRALSLDPAPPRTAAAPSSPTARGARAAGAPDDVDEAVLRSPRRRRVPRRAARRIWSVAGAAFVLTPMAVVRPHLARRRGLPPELHRRLPQGRLGRLRLQGRRRQRAQLRRRRGARRRSDDYDLDRDGDGDAC